MISAVEYHLLPNHTRHYTTSWVFAMSSSAFTFQPTGALIQEFNVGGQNIVLGFPTIEPYKDAPFFGETIGRVANRIKNGRIENLNGKSYQLYQNDGEQSLHGGKSGWGKQKFSGPEPISKDGKESVRFTYVSKDGEEGYPGTVKLQVDYTAFEEQEGNATKTILITEYEVELIGDEVEETVVNVTNHR
jgi:aldose 1-epimerase